MRIVERVAAERADERLARAGHRVLGVDCFEEQAHGAILGARVLALLLDDRAEDVGVVAIERMAEVTPAGGVHAQERRDEQRRDVAREQGLLERGHHGRDAIEQREDRRERVLDRAETALDGGLLGRRAFALRHVLDADRVVRKLRSLGEVGGALVGDELDTFETGRGGGDDALDEVGGLALLDRERVEQLALAVADVLDADKLEIDAEHAQVGRVAAELRIGRGDTESKRPVFRLFGGGLGGGTGGAGGGWGGRCCHERSVRSGSASAPQNSCAVTPCSALTRSNAQTSSSWTVRRRTGTWLNASSRVATASNAPRTGAWCSCDAATRRPRRDAVSTWSANTSRNFALSRLTRSARGPPSGMR